MLFVKSGLVKSKKYYDIKYKDRIVRYEVKRILFPSD